MTAGGRGDSLLTVSVRFVVAALGLAVLGASGASAAAASSTLSVEFNQDGSISVALGDGTAVAASGTVVPAGVYQVVVNNPYRDDADIVHKFDLEGPGVELVTDMNEGEELQDAWDETLQPSSTYTWQDDYAPSEHGSFRTSATVAASSGGSTGGSVGSGGQTDSNTPTLPSAKQSAAGTAIPLAPFRGTLRGIVKTAGTISLTRNGNKVGSLTAGRYKIVVADGSRRSGFDVQESGLRVHVVTTVPFVGKRALTLNLAAGQWFFYSTFTGKKTYFFVVA